MTSRSQWYLVGAVVAALAALAGAGSLYVRDHYRDVSVGDRAPVIQAYTLDVQPVARSLTEYSGRVVILNLWATWCIPCRIEMPSLERLHEEFHESGLSVVAVSVDYPGGEKLVRDFVKEYGLTFDVLYDPSGEVEKTYHTNGIPETFVIGRDGVIRRRKFGPDAWDNAANRALISTLLDERPAERAGGGNGS